MNEGVAIGQLVTSRAGRDRGQSYLVVEVLEGPFVLVANGGDRRVAKAKKKNLRHLVVHRTVAQDLTEARAGGRIADERVRQALQRALSAAETL